MEAGIAGPARQTRNDQEQPEQVIRDLLAAASCGDASAVEPLLAEDLLLYKVGRVRRRADLLAAVRAFAAAGGTATYALSEVVTRADARLAAITFRTRAEIQLPGQPVRRPCWLESVVLERTDRWRVVFYHSTDEAEETGAA